MIRAIILILLFFATISGFSQARCQQDACLFFIERNRDCNVILYDLNLTQTGEINHNNPIKVYWLKNEDKGQQEPLNWVQKKLAYGLKIDEFKNQEVTFQFVSYHKKQFYLKMDNHGLYRVFTLLNNKPVTVERIFIQIDGGTFWIPEISRVELHARDEISKESIVEVINP